MTGAQRVETCLGVSPGEQVALIAMKPASRSCQYRRRAGRPAATYNGLMLEDFGPAREPLRTTAVE